MIIRNITLLTLFILLLCGCSVNNGVSTNTEFEATCRKLKVRKNVAEVLQHFKKNAGKEDVRKDFNMVRAFCISRHLAYRPDPKFVDPLLTKSTIRVLLGEPHAESDSGEWIYYFDNDRTWYISLEFREQTLFYTHYRQLKHLVSGMDYHSQKKMKICYMMNFMKVIGIIKINKS